MLTLRQYEDAALLRAMAEYGTPAQEYNAAYPSGSRRAEWVEGLLAAARRGERPNGFVRRSIRAHCGQDAERLLEHLQSYAEQAEAL